MIILQGGWNRFLKTSDIVIILVAIFLLLYWAGNENGVVTRLFSVFFKAVGRLALKNFFQFSIPGTAEELPFRR